MLTISPALKAASVRYYTDTARAATAAAMDRQAANGGLGEYYSEHETRAPVWLVAGDPGAAEAVGLSTWDLAADADLAVVTRWLDDGIAPNGERGRAYNERSARGFDLTFCAPKTVSLMRALDADGVASKAISAAHARAIAEAMEYLHAHAGYTRVHNSVTGMKDLQRLPGFVAAAFQHETSRAGDPHLHTHVLLPNRQVRADGALVSYDSKSLHHEARAAGLVYQTTLRAELSASLGIEWGPIDARSGMAEVAGVDRATIAAWSQRSTQLREWASENLVVVDAAGPTVAQRAAAQRATRPRKPEHLPWAELKAMWAVDDRGFSVDEAGQREARVERIEGGRTVLDAARDAAERIDKSAFTRADLVEAIAARLPPVIDDLPADVTPRMIVEALADRVAIRITDVRESHEREGHERFTTAGIVAEERAIYDLIGASADAAVLPTDTIGSAGLSAQQARAIRRIAASRRLVQVLSAPAGAGKTTSLRALRDAAHDGGVSHVMVVAPTGKAADVALAEGAADTGTTVDNALTELRAGRLELDARTLLVVDEAGMVGTPNLRALLAAATAAGTKTVLVGDAEQLAPVKSRGGMFARLRADLPWAQDLTEVWRMVDRDERAASLAIRSARGGDLAAAVRWYRDHDRLHTGDPVTMADDALRAWTADRADGADALLIADRWDVADALNERIHRQVVGADAATITVARQHAISVGDTIITRRNDPDIAVYDRDKNPLAGAPVRNGQRWQVVKLDPDRDRIAARRIGDGVLTVLDGDYIHEHVHLGYAVTAHAAQGVTADRCHALLSPTGTRSAAYVAMTRGRHTNQAYFYEQVAGEGDHEHSDVVDGQVVARRGTTRDAAAAFTALLDRDTQPQTVVDATRDVPRSALPPQVVDLLATHDRAVNTVHVQHHPRRLAAEVAALEAAGGWSPAASYPVPEDGRHLTEDRAAVARNVAGHRATVQPVTVTDAADRSAVLSAVTRGARTDRRPVIAVPGTDRARRDARRYAPAELTLGPDELLERLDDLVGATRAQRDKLIGGLVVVDDADHLTPDQLRGLARRGSDLNMKILMVTDTQRQSGRPGRVFVDALQHVPWAQHAGTGPAADTVLGRAQDLKAGGHTIEDTRITQMVTRATELINAYTKRDTPIRVRSVDRDRSAGYER